MLNLRRVIVGQTVGFGGGDILKLINAIEHIRLKRDILFGHLVAVDFDRTKQVFVMGAGGRIFAARTAITLLGPQLDQAEIAALIRTIGDRGDLHRVTANVDFVTILIGEIEDHIIADPLNPVVMDVVVFTCHAPPIDLPVAAGVFVLDLLLGVQQ